MTNHLDETLGTPTTRRTIVRTGAKLAYAAPLVAVSFRISQRGVGAITPGFCGHSEGANGGCKGACTSAGEGCGKSCEKDICAPNCKELKGNICFSTDYCNPACFTCVDKVARFDC